MEPDLTIVDAHCHASPLWFEPVEPLVFQMDRNGVAKAVLTQVLGQFDNTYQEECLARFPGRFASVGAVAAGAEGAADEVRRWADRGMAGLRLRPEARSPGADPLAVWRAAAERGLAISCGGASANIVNDDQPVGILFYNKTIAAWNKRVHNEFPGAWGGPGINYVWVDA